jgi:RHS repeat-associated protein
VGLLIVVLLACALGGKQPQPPEPTGDGSGPGGLGISCPSYDPAVFPPDLGVSSSTATFPTVPGSFAVSPTGEATYTIPLVVPPGRAGVEPSLAITYGSSAGEGLLGVGFGLRGLSAITRCASNLAQDGWIRPVRYDAQDQLCLDGARLVEVAAEFALDGSSTHEFRTVPDSFTKVVGHFRAGTGPLSFEAYTKAGRILDYGGTADSRAMAKGQVVAAWWASKERDRHGNAVRYVYANDVDPADGHTREITPGRIGYAYRDDHKPGREVVLVHEPSPTPTTYYSGGMRLRRSQRLAEVRMITQPGEAVVRSYHLAYKPGEGTGRSLLQSVKECAGEVGPCKPETAFAWSSHADKGFTKRVTGPMYPADRYHQDERSGSQYTDTWLLADVNGDGLDDLVLSLPDPADASINLWRVALNEGGSFGAPETWASFPFPAGDFGRTWTPTPLDYDQDGLTDILLDQPNLSSNQWPTYRWLHATKGHAFTLEETSVPHPPRVVYHYGTPDPVGPFKVEHHRFMRLGDVNGDGVADLIQCVNPAWEVGLDEGPDPSLGGPRWTVNLWSPALPGGGAGFDPSPIAIPYVDGVLDCAYGAKQIYIVDIDGDGASEILAPLADGDYGALRYQEAGWISLDTTLVQQEAWRKIHFLDVNGDGLPDAIYTGLGCPVLGAGEHPCAGSAPATLGPYPGDVPFLAINDGEAFSLRSGVMLTSPASPGNWADAFGDQALPIDYDGDGRTDLMMLIPGHCGPGSDPDEACWVVLQSSPLVEGAFKVSPTPPATGYATAIDTQIPWISANYTGLPSWFLPQVTDVDGNGRHDVVVPDPDDNGTFVIYKHDGPQDLLVSIADGTNPLAPGDPGFVPNVVVHYGNLIDEGVTKGIAKSALAHDDLTYVAEEDPGNDCVYPRACVKGRERVVRSYTVNNGQNGERWFYLKYRDGRYHRLGRGFLGFGERIVIDGDTAGGVAESYDNVTYDATFDTFPFAGQVVRSRAWSATKPHWLDPGQVEMAFTERTLQQAPTYLGATYFTLPVITTAMREEGTMTPGSGKSVLRFVKAAEVTPLYVLGQASSVVSDYDTHGNILGESAKDDGADLHDTITRAYDDEPGTWLVGRLKTEQVCSTSMAMTQCRSTQVVRDAFGDVTSATMGDPADPSTQVTTALWRDAFGHVTLTTADDTSGHHRWGCTTYDADHLFPYATGNAFGHVAYTRFDAALGVMTAAVDPNGLTTQWQHDAFGSVTEERRADGTKSTVGLARTKDGGPQAKWFNAKVTTSETNGATTTTELDAAGRPVHAWTAAADVASCGAVKCTQGLVLEESTTYDFLGRVTRATLPWMSGDTLQGKAFHAYQYDAAGRMTKHTEPWGRVTTIAYGANTTTTTDWLGTTSVQVDELGRPRRATDRKGYTTETTYGPFGAAWAVMRTGLEVTWSEHDAYGRVVREVDPDRGVTDLAYDGFGEALTTDDAQGRHYAFTYDDLGRLVQRDDPDGTVRWAYDTAAHGIGKLASVTNAASVKQYAYDGLSRPAMVALTLTDTGDQLQAGFAYDGQGRLQMVAYPQVPGVNPLVVRREYDTYGNLVTVRDNADGTRYWHLQGLDGAGRPAIEKLGSGVFAYHDHDPYSGMVEHIQADRGTGAGAVTLQNLVYAYDKGLRMTSRADQLQVGPKGVRHEVFTHDELGRLTCSRFRDVPAGHALPGTLGGRCETSIAYDPTGNITSKSHVGAYTYDPAHPHAVAKAGGEGFGYDAVGNQITRPDAAITYTAFDLPEVVTPSSGDPAVHFTYDGDQQRIRKQGSSQGTLYFEGMYERVGGANGAAVHRYYVGAGSATAVLTRQVGGTDTVAYLHADALGSTDVVTDGAGKVASNAGQRRSYDAFGARRNPAWGQAAPAVGFASKASPMGFTGHEGDDELGLINMRGRIYDPRLGRFLSTDPIVSSPQFGQSWNPYSYVHNSPLNFTDPSGFQARPGGCDESCYFDKAAEKWFRTTVTKEPAQGGGTVERTTTVEVKDASRDDAKGPGGGPPPAPPGYDWEGRARGFGQAAAGFGAGYMLGSVPYAGMAAQVAMDGKVLDRGTREAQVGKALGEIVAGLKGMFDGIQTARGGLTLLATGGGAPAGAAVVAVASTAAVGSLANAAAGVRGLSQALLSTGGGLRPEKKYTSSGKHGLKWSEGPAEARSSNVSQGQWGSAQDLEYAGQKASELKPGEGDWFQLPEGHTSVVHRPDGTTVRATRFWVRNNGTGTLHGYPAE